MLKIYIYIFLKHNLLSQCVHSKLFDVWVGDYYWTKPITHVPIFWSH